MKSSGGAVWRPSMFGQTSSGGFTQSPSSSLPIPAGTSSCTPSRFGQTSAGGVTQFPDDSLTMPAGTCVWMPSTFGHRSVGGGTQLPDESLIRPAGTCVWSPSMFGQTSVGGAEQAPESVTIAERDRLYSSLGQLPFTLSVIVPTVLPDTRSVNCRTERAAIVLFTGTDARFDSRIVSVSGSVRLSIDHVMTYSPLLVSHVADPEAPNVQASAPGANTSDPTTTSPAVRQSFFNPISLSLDPQLRRTPILGEVRPS